MVKSTCRFCSRTEDVRKLVDPCDCYKKYDSMLCHPACLEKHIADRRQSERDHISDEADVCRVCGKKFRVKLLWKWTSNRIFSTTSCGMYFNFAALLFSAFAFFYSAFYLLNSDVTRIQSYKPERQQQRETTLVVGLVVVIAVLMVFVVHRLYHRWKRHQMDAELLDIV
eukprot:evm.model.scf_711.2 EVM.evm.TU.scf_711.2   scf_711:26458-28702(-)